MSITPLSAARIAGELGLAGGTITGGTYAAHYSNQVTVVKHKAEIERAPLSALKTNVTGKLTMVRAYGSAIRNKYQGSEQTSLTKAIEEMSQVIGLRDYQFDN